MQYGGASLDEMEVTIRLDRETQQAHIRSTWPEWSRKLERLFGSPRKEAKRDGKVTSAFWTIPLLAIRVRRPPQARQVTEEERLALADRLQKARLSRVSLTEAVG